MATFVLVHGAFLGGWCWQRVAERLRAVGHVVQTPTLTGCGDRIHLLTREVGLSTHVEDLRQLFAHERLHDVILVGHSYGGTVITAAAGDVLHQVRTLIYLDAQAPRDGETGSGALAAGTTGTLETMTQGTGWLLDPLPLDAVGVVAPDDVAWVQSRRHAHPMRTLLEAVHLPSGALDHIDAHYIVCTQDAGLVGLFGVHPLARCASRARESGWGMTEIDAPHDCMITSPALVADALLAHV
jgi:pimeloyl-ACP methyl ester carboxylesterase